MMKRFFHGAILRHNDESCIQMYVFFETKTKKLSKLFIFTVLQRIAQLKTHTLNELIWIFFANGLQVRKYLDNIALDIEECIARINIVFVAVQKTGITFAHFQLARLP